MPLLAPIAASAPAIPPPTRVPPAFQRIRMSWTSWTGDQWEITDPRSGVFVTQDGLEGLQAPELVPWSSTSPALDGARYRGERVEPRECFWPIYVYSDVSSAEFLERDRAFWKSLRRGKVGTWKVTAPDGSSVRSLDVRFSKLNDPQDDRDPVAFGWRRYGIVTTAWRPYWLGETNRRTFTPDEAPEPFYAAEHETLEDDSAILFISSNSTSANAEITNPGDIATAPLVQLDGPLDAGASVGIGSDVTTWAPAIAEGKSVVIDTRPDHLTANLIDTPSLELGSDEWWRMVDGLDPVGQYTSLSSVAYRATVEGGETSPLEVNMHGQGAIHVLIRGLHERAY